MKKLLATPIALLIFSAFLWAQNREQEWKLTLPLASARLLPENQKAGTGVIGEMKTLTAIWQASDRKGSPAPQIDFEKSVLLFARNEEYFNAIQIADVSVANGVATPNIIESRSAVKLETVKKLNVALKVVPRAGLKAVRTDKGEVAVP